MVLLIYTVLTLVSSHSRVTTTAAGTAVVVYYSSACTSANHCVVDVMILRLVDCLFDLLELIFYNRMDMCIDGLRNNVIEADNETETAGPHNPHNNAFYSKEQPLTSELKGAYLILPVSN
jgi:Copper amine oxidase, enzyme domain